MLGLASTIQQPGILGNAEIFSPRPVASAVPPYTQKAISEPISELISANSSIERPSSQMTFNPLSAAPHLNYHQQVPQKQEYAYQL